MFGGEATLFGGKLLAGNSHHPGGFSGTYWRPCPHGGEHCDEWDHSGRAWGRFLHFPVSLRHRHRWAACGASHRGLLAFVSAGLGSARLLLVRPALVRLGNHSAGSLGLLDLHIHYLADHRTQQTNLAVRSHTDLLKARLGRSGRLGRIVGYCIGTFFWRVETEV